MLLVLSGLVSGSAIQNFATASMYSEAVLAQPGTALAQPDLALWQSAVHDKALVHSKTALMQCCGRTRYFCHQRPHSSCMQKHVQTGHVKPRALQPSIRMLTMCDAKLCRSITTGPAFATPRGDIRKGLCFQNCARHVNGESPAL